MCTRLLLCRALSALRRVLPGRVGPTAAQFQRLSLHDAVESPPSSRGQDTAHIREAA
jgi:hypothetical protein